MRLGEVGVTALEAAKAYGKNPLILLPALILMVGMFLMGRLSLYVLPFLQTNAANILWSILAIVLQLLILAVCFSALLSYAYTVVTSRSKGLSRMFLSVWKRTGLNFLLLLTTTLTLALLNVLAITVGKYLLAISTTAALGAVMGVWVLGFVGGVIFLAFANILCVIHGTGFWTSIRESAHLVRRNYPFVLFISLLFFALIYMFDRFLPDLLAELIKTLVLLPYLSLFLVFFLKKIKNYDLSTR